MELESNNSVCTNRFNDTFLDNISICKEGALSISELQLVEFCTNAASKNSNIESNEQVYFPQLSINGTSMMTDTITNTNIAQPVSISLNQITSVDDESLRINKSKKQKRHHSGKIKPTLIEGKSDLAKSKMVRRRTIFKKVCYF